MRFPLLLGAALLSVALTSAAKASVIAISFCSGATTCAITTSPPNPVVEDPNDGAFLIWEEKQHLTLDTALQVDRVLDSGAAYVNDLGNGKYEFVPGTTISSYYVQWDPGNDSSSRAVMTVDFDAAVLAFITSDESLGLSNSPLGLASIDYGSFGNRGLEPDDITNFSGFNAVLSWHASTPGDWARVVTAATPVPVPPSLLAGMAAFGSLAVLNRRRRA